MATIEFNDKDEIVNSENRMYKLIVKKLNSSLTSRPVRITWSDMYDNETEMNHAIQQLKRESYKVETSFEYKGYPGIRGETIYTHIITRP